MVRRCFALLLLLLLCIVCVWPAPVMAAGGQQKEYRASAFDEDIQIQPDGALLVTETVTFRFSGGPFTSVFRALTPNKGDNITFEDAAMKSDNGQYDDLFLLALLSFILTGILMGSITQYYWCLLFPDFGLLVLAAVVVGYRGALAR
ncbi:DUF2207 domain-containing protein [Dictyobacter kobayashii]|uniref:DUF2207 domain-containing protein n=1 Tax=Dictyobacter kobayashii TaxID=2014872 RepID=A0A402AQV0_9CHLR|nr:DUF2207 domain-containing protein [Dictyobacter kobayashii]GCE21471.1 hypothetical protein KDK_52710 [Dictyobacter kobayashii]